MVSCLQPAAGASQPRGTGTELGTRPPHLTLYATRCSSWWMSGKRKPKKPSSSAPRWFSPLAWYCKREPGVCEGWAAAATGSGTGG